MADNNLFKAFGFEIKRSKTANKEDDKATSIVPKVDEDGAGYVTASGSYFGQYVDMEGTGAKDNQELIKNIVLWQNTQSVMLRSKISSTNQSFRPN